MPACYCLTVCMCLDGFFPGSDVSHHDQQLKYSENSDLITFSFVYCPGLMLTFYVLSRATSNILYGVLDRVKVCYNSHRKSFNYFPYLEAPWALIQLTSDLFQHSYSEIKIAARFWTSHCFQHDFQIILSDSKGMTEFPVLPNSLPFAFMDSWKDYHQESKMPKYIKTML